MRKDVIILGAGIVGVSIALHLQKRGRSVLLIDKREPGRETVREELGRRGELQSHRACSPIEAKPADE